MDKHITNNKINEYDIEAMCTWLLHTYTKSKMIFERIKETNMKFTKKKKPN